MYIGRSMVTTNQKLVMGKQKREMTANIILKIVINHKGREQKKRRTREKNKKQKPKNKTSENNEQNDNKYVLINNFTLNVNGLNAPIIG